MGANPVDRGKPGSKLDLVCDGGGLPLTAVVTAANVNDAMMLQAVLDDVPPVLTPSGRRRHRPGKVHGDKAYDSAANRAYLRASGDPAADRPAWGGILDAAWAAAVEGGTVAVVVELLAAAGGALGPGLRAVVRVRAGGLRGGLFQPALRKVQDESLARSPGRCHTRKTVPGARRSGWQAGRRGGAA